MLQSGHDGQADGSTGIDGPTDTDTRICICRAARLCGVLSEKKSLLD
jgi:hypothetical protein